MQNAAKERIHKMKNQYVRAELSSKKQKQTKMG